ncbi:MAG TPA: hypothetical protein VHM24_00340 [Gemmatimonadaceae bacterium]|nr:hypothetical protein [Gemmatimonadaceae bacterium]
MRALLKEILQAGVVEEEFSGLYGALTKRRLELVNDSKGHWMPRQHQGDESQKRP